MQTFVQKWGNSLGIRIPLSFVKDFGLKSGTSVDIIEEEGKIVIVPKRITLKDLLEKITDENRQDVIETGKSVGKEEW
jgi:antitoxin MazE